MKMELTNSKIQTIYAIDYMTNAKGDLIPISNIKESDIERDEFVSEAVANWKAQSASLKQFKFNIIGDLMAFIELQAEKHGVKMGGKKGNVSLQTYDGEYRIRISIAEHKSFNEQISFAKEIIDQLVRDWSSDSNTNLITLVNSAFDIDEQGNISTAKIFGLLRMEIHDETGQWKKAMELIKDSITIVGSKQYLNVYQRDEQGKYQLIPLDIASL